MKCFEMNELNFVSSLSCRVLFMLYFRLASHAFQAGFFKKNLVAEAKGTFLNENMRRILQIFTKVEKIEA